MRPRPLALALACLTSSTLAFAAEPSAPSAAPRAGASEPESGFADRFFRGTSPGHLPAEKALVIGTLYVGSLTSVGFGIASLLHAGSQSDDADAFKLGQQQGFCSDLAGTACATYRGLLSDERKSRATGVALLGLGGLLAVSGALTAELWQNDGDLPRLALSLDRSSVFLGATTRF